MKYKDTRKISTLIKLTRLKDSLQTKIIVITKAVHFMICDPFISIEI